MSTKRKSAFSVYKMQRKVAENDENMSLNAEDCEEVETSEQLEAAQSSDSLLSGGKKAKLIMASSEGSENPKAKTKRFARASRIRQSIGSISLNKKRKKSKRMVNESNEQTDSDKDNLITRKDADNVSPGIVKMTESLPGGFIKKVTCESEVAELPRKTFEWLISPVTTEKFFRYILRVYTFSGVSLLTCTWLGY